MTTLRIADRATWSACGPDALDTEPAAAVHAPDLPPGGIRPVPGFDPAVEIGPKGIRSMDRATAFAVAAAGRLLDRAAPADRSRTALVLATTAGSLQTMLDLGTDSLTKPRPHQVDPGRIPVGVMNYAAGQCAIHHRITGPGVILPGGRSAPVLALRYARRLLASGRVDQVLCGASEEATPARAWLEHRTRPATAPTVPIGEGCAMLRLVADTAPGPRITAAATELDCTGDPASALATALRRALATAATDPDEIRTAATTAALDGHHDAETRALTAVLGPAATRLTAHTAIGDTSAAAAAFALLHALDATAPGDAFAVTTLDRRGLAGCLIGRA
ncbi:MULTISPECIES: beta-ketoacyl synthase N-terminal-like domain-containing protein [Glycomyces]|uniref:3-oxoacyl-[acyl-carrier-protein] synthase II n=2 Tax=Glycomyces TaxID=58113 RepID=A0A9X3SSS2_9ACTN|nr:beta-ketoacyl synthase N-terminal-like domain-containing protein [Glycomyces lechevalierae]MDA1383415.1 beta-ketoacyl synthase N-terminal-like domain-containing protein [Glycomyces lechevalierae]MDR7336421.1 3-oxoacyl-[acyl-carrier-protein] synthase II [Glycomyces lechevalierae]